MMEDIYEVFITHRSQDPTVNHLNFKVVLLGGVEYLEPKKLTSLIRTLHRLEILSLPKPPALGLIHLPAVNAGDSPI